MGGNRGEAGGKPGQGKSRSEDLGGRNLASLRRYRRVARPTRSR